MAGGWWAGVGKAIETISALTGGRSGADESATAPAQGRGLMSGVEARLAGVLVSALHEAFARDAARLDAEREQAEAERRRAEAAMRLEIARQAADRQLAHLRAIITLDVIVWLASLLAFVVHPFAGISRILLAVAWTVLTAGLGTAFVAYGRVSHEATLGRLAMEERDAAPSRRLLETASWLAVSGLGLAAASVIVSVA